MDLAEPALRASAAFAEPSPDAGAATVDAAIPKREALADPPEKVEPATIQSGLDEENVTRASDDASDVKGNRITVANLRGTGGSDFESKAAVLRGIREKNILAKLLPCVFGERDFVSYGETLRYVVVKGDNAFIFTEINDVAPLYAIPLIDKVAIKEDPNNPEGTSLTISPSFNNVSKEDLDTVLLKYNHEGGKIAYQFTFSKHDGADLANRFLDAVDAITSFKTGDKVITVHLSGCLADLLRIPNLCWRLSFSTLYMHIF